MYMGMVGNALRAEVKSHYNPITNHCYALVDVTKNSGYNWPKTPNNYKSLAWYDAQGRDILLPLRRKAMRNLKTISEETSFFRRTKRSPIKLTC